MVPQVTFDIHEDVFESLDDLIDIPGIRNMPQREQRATPARLPNNKTRRKQLEVATLMEQSDTQETFDFTYQASHHERGWIIDSIGPFYEGQWVDDVLRLIKGGKEAHVYQCQANLSVTQGAKTQLENGYIAVKVYRPRKFRNLRKDYIYRQGRELLDSDGQPVIKDRDHRAVEQRSDYGKKLMHESWIEHEFQTLKKLHAAGADVPLPLERGNNAILMAYVGGEVIAAPTLNEIELEPTDALTLYHRTMKNIDLMLSNNLVHGDLSAYNILYWEGEITFIDFPQAIDPNRNPDAYSIFMRDIQRVCEYFIRQGIRTNPRQLAKELWSSHGHRISPEVHPGILDADDEQDRAYWQSIYGS